MGHSVPIRIPSRLPGTTGSVPYGLCGRLGGPRPTWRNLSLQVSVIEAGGLLLPRAYAELKTMGRTGEFRVKTGIYALRRCS